MTPKAIDQIHEDARKWREYQKSLKPVKRRVENVNVVHNEDGEVIGVRESVERLTPREEQRVGAALAFAAQKPTIGRIVLYTFPSPFVSNYTLPQGQSQMVPAIITNVFSDTVVNLTVFVDSRYGPLSASSIGLKESRESMRDPAIGFWEWPTRE